MPMRADANVEFGRLGRRVIEANFEGGDTRSDGDVLLLRRVDERISLSRAAAAVLSDPRNPAHITHITHSLRDLLVQRIYVQAAVQYAAAMLADEYAHAGIKQRLIDESGDAADSWEIERRVLTRRKYGAQGNNPSHTMQSG